MRFAVTIFVSAFLLFQVQPVIARYILPWYGGSPAVWTSAMLFFQTGLLIGYSYAHVVSRILHGRQQAILHVALLVLSLLVLPITPSDSLEPDGSGSPVLGILLLLATTVGAPYVLISATGPLLQHWYSRRYPGRSPYRLYALSNLGSLLGLLTYPFVFERALSVPSQTRYWSIGYGLFILACGMTAWTLHRWVSKPARTAPIPDASVPPTETKRLGFVDPLMWLGLSACGSILLLAVTNKLTQDVAVVAFLWIVPLSLYLITFIIAFDGPRWYHRGIWITGLCLIMPVVIYLVRADLALVGKELLPVLGIYLLVMFFGCMVCHGEMVRLKPPPEHLTAFYLFVSLGGALGGVFVGVIAPLVFTGFWELHLALVLVAVLAGLSVLKTAGRATRGRLKQAMVASWVVAVFAAALFLAEDVTRQKQGQLTITRNFYGILRVVESSRGRESHRYKFYHGSIQHGHQFQNEDRRRLPTSYYSKYSGASIAIRRHPKRVARKAGMPGLRVGVIGLGVGTLAVYAEEGDTFRFYEIDPDVERLARSYFTFLSDANGDMQTVIGDGRTSLERELAQHGAHQFDVLAVDAFSGDAIPVHLMTREACQLYWQHLAPDGILAFHISNRYLDLKPVALALAKAMDKRIILITAHKNPSKGTKTSNWVLLTNNDEFLAQSDVENYRQTRWPADGDPEILWTDDYSSLVDLLK